MHKIQLMTCHLKKADLLESLSSVCLRTGEVGGRDIHANLSQSSLHDVLLLKTNAPFWRLLLGSFRHSFRTPEIASLICSIHHSAL